MSGLGCSRAVCGYSTKALPPIVVAAGVLFLFTGQFSGPDPDLVSRYHIAVKNALARDDVSEATALAATDDVRTTTDNDAGHSRHDGMGAGAEDQPAEDDAQSD